MTKNELLSLPPTIAIGLIYEASANLQKAIAGMEKPKGPLPPRYDRRLRRKGGQYVYASESTLESLTFWLGKNREGASNGGEYAEKNAKEAAELERWVNWRTWYPTEVWTGTRGQSEGVRAAPPSKHPKLHSWEPRQEPSPQRGDAYEGDAGQGDDDFPPEDF